MEQSRAVCVFTKGGYVIVVPSVSAEFVVQYMFMKQMKGAIKQLTALTRDKKLTACLPRFRGLSVYQFY